jgi:predicted nucleic acid-binding protein
MRLVIADTGPVNYLLLIGHIDILPALFEKVTLPSAVKDELAIQEAPDVVRSWITATPAWIDVRDPKTQSNELAGQLGAGETAAILLAAELHADLVLMDDRRGVAAAIQRGLAVTGTMGLLSRAAKRGFLDLADAFERLRGTNFRCRREIMDALLRKATD